MLSMGFKVIKYGFCSPISIFPPKIFPTRFFQWHFPFNVATFCNEIWLFELEKAQLENFCLFQKFLQSQTKVFLLLVSFSHFNPTNIQFLLMWLQIFGHSFFFSLRCWLLTYEYDIKDWLSSSSPILRPLLLKSRQSKEAGHPGSTRPAIIFLLWL